ncbi:hypothetical protein HYDPIDRAFT_183158 [Hydnomerulius pinastri MD-312]|uniref:MYND-type domain-containing protein n=1 Tax=Hydnomerulius pinastri MD-312 TaxID=994086 RepID=A0A0C9V790_9AGAM|nr:hypothetical protein HYDPIDRAFT_183158 [Hydnomerulius pinastri MD-312]
MEDAAANRTPTFPPFTLTVLPCANAQVEKYTACENPGKMACSACRLVSYCSNECQKAHWKTHKRDCNDRIRSSGWKPAWVAEGRDPTFHDHTNMSTSEEFRRRFEEKLAIGLSLWGNIPAMDVINLPHNEKNSKMDLSLAFAASGDLRHIVETINSLGPEYSGKINILLNDIQPGIVSRNILLLLILATVPDEATAADIALHFWYSVLLPMEYRLRIFSIVTTLLRQGSLGRPITTDLGPHSKLTCMVSSSVQQLMVSNAGPTITLDQAQKEYDRVRNAPSRLDYRDRMYIGLKPSHRLAFLKFRRFGVVLPFGAVNAHFNVPNPSLFSHDGEWLQTDYADPLVSWDLDKVVEAGKAHGAQLEDIYGCLYFFLSDQLLAFARRIRKLHVSFHVFNSEACALAEEIVKGTFSAYGLPPTVRFDRIDVSNILDPNYVGTRLVLNMWEPLLAKSDNAALLGYFMNWMAFEKAGRAMDAGRATSKGILDQMMRDRRFQPGLDLTTTMYMMAADADAFYDNSTPFSRFLKTQGLENAQRETKLKLRKKHQIIPHRVRTLVGGEPGELPYFPDDESWYRWSRLVSLSWTERFVEFSRVQD